MGRVLVYFGRFALIFVAYVCASLTASAFIHLVSLRALGFEVYDTPQALTGALAFSIPFVALFVSYFAFLPALPMILAAEAFGWRSWLFYALAGGAIALVIIALAIQASEPGDNPFADTRLSGFGRRHRRRVGLLAGGGTACRDLASEGAVWHWSQERMIEGGPHMPEHFNTTREAWLRNEIAARLEEMRAHPSLGIPAVQVFAELEAHHRARLEELRSASRGSEDALP